MAVSEKWHSILEWCHVVIHSQMEDIVNIGIGCTKSCCGNIAWLRPLGQIQISLVERSMFAWKAGEPQVHHGIVVNKADIILFNLILIWVRGTLKDFPDTLQEFINSFIF